MRQLFFLIILVLITFVSQAQYIITFKNGHKAKVKLIESTGKELIITEYGKENEPLKWDKKYIDRYINSITDSIQKPVSFSIFSNSQTSQKTEGQLKQVIVDSDTTCLIWLCRTLKKGFYKTYEEYIHNSPSIIRKFKIVEKSSFSSISGAGGASGDYKYVLEDGEEKVGKHWGICDGEKVFVDLNVANSKQLFWALDFVGRNPSFTYVYHAGLLTTIVNATTNGIEMFINDEGKFENLTIKNLQKLFSSQPELLKEFNADPNQRSKRKAYVKKFNENSNN